MYEEQALVPSPMRGQAPIVMYAVPDPAEEEPGLSIDMHELRAMLFRQRWVILSCLAACLLIGLGLTAVATPIYRATATMQIEQNVPILEDGQEAVEPQVTSSNMQQFMRSQLDVLKSRSLAQQVARELKLENNAAFLDAMQITSTGPARLGQIAGRLRAGLVADLPTASQTMSVSFDSPDPTVSAKIANAFVDNLITSNLDRRYQASSYARQFLSREMERAKQRLEASERAALAYARQNQIVNIGTASPGGENGDAGGAPPSLSATNLVQMNSALAQARTARIQAEERWRAAAGASVMQLPEVVQNGTVAGLQAERARLAGELAKLQQSFGENYPQVGQLRSQIAAVDSQISAIANQVRSTIRKQYEVAARQEGGIASRMGRLQSLTLEDQDRRVRFDIITREAATNRQLYDALLQRYRQVSTAAGVSNNNISILDPAVPPGGPIRPSLMKNLILAGFLGIVLGFVLGFLRERLDDSFRSPEDVSTKLKLPLIGTTPKLLGRRDVREELDDRKSPISEAYHSIRSSIEFSGHGGFPKSLLITSSRPGEGKSTTAVAVATDAARLGRKILLVDADLRMPSLHDVLQVPNQEGFVNVLVGHRALEATVVEANGFFFLPSGPIPPNPTDLLAPHVVHAFINEALSKFELVIFDGPPVLGLADAPQLARVTEGTVLVLEAGKAHRRQAKTAIKRLEAANANIIGVILSKFSGESSGYGDQYGYTYSYEAKRSGPKWLPGRAS